MLKTLTCLFSTLIILSVPATASACRAYRPPQARVNGSFDAVVFATITESAFVKGYTGEGPAWQASAKITHTFSGKPDVMTFTFGRTGSSAACDDGQPIALVGETWVLYLWKPENDTWMVADSYPLSLARKIDKRFTASPEGKKKPR